MKATRCGRQASTIAGMTLPPLDVPSIEALHRPSIASRRQALVLTGLLTALATVIAVAGIGWFEAREAGVLLPVLGANSSPGMWAILVVAFTTSAVAAANLPRLMAAARGDRLARGTRWASATILAFQAVALGVIALSFRSIQPQLLGCAGVVAAISIVSFALARASSPWADWRRPIGVLVTVLATLAHAAAGALIVLAVFLIPWGMPGSARFEGNDRARLVEVTYEFDGYRSEVVWERYGWVYRPASGKLTALRGGDVREAAHRFSRVVRLARSVAFRSASMRSSTARMAELAVLS